MIELHPEYIIDEKLHKKSVVIPFAEWEKIMDAMDELDDIRAYDMALMKNDDIILFEQAVSEINAGIVE